MKSPGVSKPDPLHLCSFTTMTAGCWSRRPLTLLIGGLKMLKLNSPLTCSETEIKYHQIRLRPGDGWEHAATDMLHHINGTLDTAIRGGWVNYGRYIL